MSRKNKCSISQIAISLDRAVSTVRREIKRNTSGRGYRHLWADKKTKERHEKKKKATKLTTELSKKITDLIEQQWSPEQVCGRLQLGNNDKKVISKETIYQYLKRDRKAGGLLYKSLRRAGKAYRKPYGKNAGKDAKYRGIIGRVDIDERPEVVNSRDRVGDWEADTIVGKNHKGVIVTLDERKSKLRLAFPLNSKHSGRVCDAIISLLDGFSQVVHTITFAIN